MTTVIDDISEPLVRRLSVIGLWLLIINGMIAAGIFAVEVTMTGGLSGGAGAVALKGLLVAQSPKLMSKLHERLCGTPFTKADAGLVTQVETAIEKAVSLPVRRPGRSRKHLVTVSNHPDIPGIPDPGIVSHGEWGPAPGASGF